MRKALPWLLLAALGTFLAWKLHTSHFQFRALLRAARAADPRLLLAAVVCIYAGSLLRAARWALFLRPAYRTRGVAAPPWWRLIGTQYIGFTGLALFGRIGELVRPLLVARRTGLTFSSQVAVVAVERIFDLGAFGLLFTANLLLSPGLNALPYHQRFRAVGVAIAVLLCGLAALVLAVRLAGGAVAAAAQRALGGVSERFAAGVADKILAFRDGLDVLDGVGASVAIVALSLLLWSSVALAYFAVMKAFPLPVHALSLPDCVLLLGFSVVGGAVQLPAVGGGAQLLVIGALGTLFGVPAELATGAGLTVWIIGAWSVVPAGLLFARIEGVSLRGLVRPGYSLDSTRAGP